MCSNNINLKNNTLSVGKFVAVKYLSYQLF